MKRGASMWSSNFLIAVTVKFRVLLAIPRNKARKAQGTLQVVQYWDVLSMQKNLSKKRMDGSDFLRWFVPYYTLCLYNQIYICTHRSPRRKVKKWTHVARILPWDWHYIHGPTSPSLPLLISSSMMLISQHWKAFNGLRKIHVTRSFGLIL